MSRLSNDNRTAEEIIQELERLRGVACTNCGCSLCHHQVLMSIALGFSSAPRCLVCLAAGLDCDPAGIRDSVFAYIHQRECYFDAWKWANRDSGEEEGVMPAKLESITPRGAAAHEGED